MITKFFLMILFISCNFVFSQEIDIKIVDESRLDSIRRDRNEKALLINVWATWCIPCREELPDLMRIAEIYNDRLDVLGLCINYPEEIQNTVIPFVTKNKLNFPILMNGFKKDERLINYLEENWGGAIPVSLIYDKNGNKVYFIEGKRTFAYFAKKIESLLKINN